MKILRILPLLLAAFVILGCSLSVDVPTIDTTSIQVVNVSEPVPAGVDTATVNIEMGAGKLTLTPGAENLVEGTITYNVLDWKPKVTPLSNGVLISQNHSTNVGVPDNDVKNIWDLKLGNSPIDLKISAGAYEGSIDLSGLSITNLEISDGASKSTVRFDSANPVDMQRLVYKTGASQVDLIGMGNANVSEISFEGGAGSYSLDFSGDLKKDVSVKIASGMSDTKITIPSGVHTIVNINGGLTNVDPSGTWTINGSTYSTGSGSPTITIDIEMAVGNLSLTQN